VIDLKSAPADPEVPDPGRNDTAVDDAAVRQAVETANRLLRYSPDQAGDFALAMHERTAWDLDGHWRDHWQCVSALLAQPGKVSSGRRVSEWDEEEVRRVRRS
jgi:hypothetical protein